MTNDMIIWYSENLEVHLSYIWADKNRNNIYDLSDNATQDIGVEIFREHRKQFCPDVVRRRQQQDSVEVNQGGILSSCRKHWLLIAKIRF